MCHLFFNRFNFTKMRDPFSILKFPFFERCAKTATILGVRRMHSTEKPTSSHLLSNGAAFCLNNSLLTFTSNLTNPIPTSPNIIGLVRPVSFFPPNFADYSLIFLNAICLLTMAPTIFLFWPKSFIEFFPLIFFLQFHHHKPVHCCSPPPPSPFPNNNQPISPSARHSPSRLFGEQTQQGGGGTEFSPGIDRATALSGPVKTPEELYCYDFDDKCRWRNMEGLLVDELDWYQGAGFLDENRLRLTTGTHFAPEGFYGIAATDRVEFPGTKAILVSDVIECQMGVANLRFHYWTSPEVKIIVCVKSVLRLFPYFDYCSKPIENGDPGPVFVTLPEINEPMQIFIQAHNFVFTSSAIQGGFAIIDNLEYFGEFCEREPDPKSQFAAARNAPPQSALRPDYQQLLPLPSLNGGGKESKKSFDEVQQTQQPIGPFEGFRSMLDWMIYGNGLARQSKLQDLLLNSTMHSTTNGPIDNLVHQIETVPTPPPPPNSLTESSKLSESTQPKFPELLGNELRSVRVVKRPPINGNEENGNEGGGGHQMQRPIRPMDIRNSLLMNGQMPFNIRRRQQPNLAQRRNRLMEKWRIAEEDEREKEQEDGMEEENEPNQVEREEWIG